MVTVYGNLHGFQIKINTMRRPCCIEQTFVVRLTSKNKYNETVADEGSSRNALCALNAIFTLFYHVLRTKLRKFAYIILKEHYDCICLP
jgi:hypothetical protein